MHGTAQLEVNRMEGGGSSYLHLAGGPEFRDGATLGGPDHVTLAADAAHGRKFGGQCLLFDILDAEPPPLTC
jgi:hypothetical protein